MSPLVEFLERLVGPPDVTDEKGEQQAPPKYPDNSPKPVFMHHGPELSGIGTKLTAGGRSSEEATMPPDSGSATAMSSFLSQLKSWPVVAGWTAKETISIRASG